MAELAALDQVGENICDVSGACADLFESMGRALKEMRLEKGLARFEEAGFMTI